MKPWQSKTLWFNLIVAILALVIPSFQDIVTSNPLVSLVISAVINFVLRLITHQPVSLAKKPLVVEVPK